MAANEDLAAWLIPVAGADVLIPYQLVLGTEIGEIIVRLTRFEVVDPGLLTAGIPRAE
jgi:hypothetical protein